MSESSPENGTRVANPIKAKDPRRVAAGRVGAFRLHATHDPRVTSANGRAKIAANLNARLLAELDPNNELDEAERARRLEYARKAHFVALRMRVGRGKRGVRK